MDSEMFTVGGTDGVDGGLWGKAFKMSDDKKYDTTEAGMKLAAAKVAAQSASLMHSLKLLVRVALVIAVIFMVLYVLKAPAQITSAWKAAIKSDFTQKENLQWLGASADVLRGDLEYNKDSLAEQAAKRDQRVTDISTPLPVKATFYSRERMSGTPEEELMKKIEANKV